MTSVWDSIKPQYVEAAGKFLSERCQFHGISAADVIAAIGDFETFWSRYPKTESVDHWRPAVDDAIRSIKRRAERKGVIAARHAYAARTGQKVCTRCGGEGGASQWPGWTCFDCGGTGFVKDEK